jgi:hypothetical protein
MAYKIFEVKLGIYGEIVRIRRREIFVLGFKRRVI